MPWERDVHAFDERASRYDNGWRATMHREIVLRTIEIALSLDPDPASVLDVGCGTGILLGVLAERLPGSTLAGVDAAPRMIAAAKESHPDSRVVFKEATAENLPFADGEFDLVVSTTSFDHWENQQQGLRECARILKPLGNLVCVDQFSPLLWPTLLSTRRGKARTKRRLQNLLESTEFHNLEWYEVYATIIKGFSARLRG